MEPTRPTRRVLRHGEGYVTGSHLPLFSILCATDGRSVKGLPSQEYLTFVDGRKVSEGVAQSGISNLCARDGRSVKGLSS